jgi:flavin-dependent dehydrogenase
VEPFLGEGIYYALLSGQFGGETVSRALRTGRADLTAYDRAIAERILPEFDFALRLARIIYCWPGLFWWLLKRHPGIMNIYFSILQGQESYGLFFWELKKRLRRITGLYHILGEPPRPAVL